MREREREKQRGADAGEEEGGGGAPWPAGLSSPEMAATELWGSIFKSEGTGRKRERRRVRIRPQRGRGASEWHAPWPTAMEFAGARG